MKEHTIIFVPHARAKFRKWRFTSLQAGLVLGSLVILTLGGIGAGILYLGTSFDHDQLVAIQDENAELRQVNEEFEKTIREIEGQLAEFDGKVEQLAIVAGVSELSSTLDAGIGGPMSMEAGRIQSGPVELPANNSPGHDGGFNHLSLLESWTDQLGQNLGVLQDELAKREVWISQTPAVTPVKGILASAYGYRADPFTKKRTFHGGIDISAPRGKEVAATGDGIVIKTGRAQGLGIAVYVAHGYGLTTRYGHLLKVTVEEGQRVQRGDTVGLVGNTGRSTGYHLHYEVRLHGKSVNPLGYILDHQ